MNVRAPSVPLFARAGETMHVGAGFIGHDGLGHHWLATAAHIPTNSQPTLNFDLWPETLVAWGTERSFEYPLFLRSGASRHPQFGYAVDSTGTMTDLMVLRLPNVGLNDGAVSLVSTIADFSTEYPEPVSGDPVRGFGFPGLVNDRWPYHPPNRIEGHFIYKEGPAYKASLPILQGHSGGPVYRSRAGDLVGMMIGTDDVGRCTIVPQSAIVEMIRLTARKLNPLG